jgi:hypothetical protein
VAANRAGKGTTQELCRSHEVIARGADPLAGSGLKPYGPPERRDPSEHTPQKTLQERDQVREPWLPGFFLHDAQGSVRPVRDSPRHEQSEEGDRRQLCCMQTHKEFSASRRSENRFEAADSW